jgi:hypothetical protein
MEWLELKEFDYPMEEAVQEIYESSKLFMIFIKKRFQGS